MAPSPAPTPTPTPTIPSSLFHSFDSHGSPSPSITPGPLPDLSIQHKQLHYAYAVPVERLYEEPRLHNNGNSTVSSSSSIISDRLEGTRVDGEAIGYNRPSGEGRSWKGKEREWVNRSEDGNGSRLAKKGSRRRRGLPLGLVGDMEDARRSLEKRLPMAEGCELLSSFLPLSSASPCYECELTLFSTRPDPSCNLVGNGVLSCFPESDTTIVQSEYSKFIWNANFPTFIVRHLSFRSSLFVG